MSDGKNMFKFKVGSRLMNDKEQLFNLIIDQITDYRVICRLSKVSRLWNKIASSNRVWKRITINTWPDRFPPRDNDISINNGTASPNKYHNTLFAGWKDTFRQSMSFDRKGSKVKRGKSTEAILQSQGRNRKICDNCSRPANACICSALPRSIDEMVCNCALKIVVLLHPACPLATGTLRILMKVFTNILVLKGITFTRTKYPGMLIIYSVYGSLLQSWMRF